MRWNTDREVGRGGHAGAALREGPVLMFRVHEWKVLWAEQGGSQVTESYCPAPLQWEVMPAQASGDLCGPSDHSRACFKHLPPTLVGRSMDSGARLSGFKTQLSYLLAVCPWASYLTYVSANGYTISTSLIA